MTRERSGPVRRRAPERDDPSVGGEPSPLLGGARGLAQVGLAAGVLVLACALVAAVVAAVF